MSVGYRIAYRLGLTPWEAAGEGFGPQLAAELDGYEAGIPAPFREALDLGCGTGVHTIGLARRGWQTTGVDAVPAAVEQARARAVAADADVKFVQGDATRLEASVGMGYQLLLDVGCLHRFGPSNEPDTPRERPPSPSPNPRC